MTKSPNILLIQADQHRYDCIGYSRDYPVLTPHIDRLAREGMWFNNAYTPIPICGPARQSLMNGRRPESFGSLWNYDQSLKTGALDPSEYAWPRDLQRKGYRTGYVGKWHVNPNHDPLEYGFDDYDSDAQYSQMRKQKYPHIEFKNGFFGEADPVNLEDTHTHWSVNKAIKRIRQYTEYTEEAAPWFIHLNFQDPHPPCRPIQRFAEMYRADSIPKWRSFDDDFHNKPYIQKQQLYNWGIEHYTWEDWASTVALYYGAISQMDDAVGRALNVLDELGLTEETVVIYTSDHGDMCGSHRMMDKHYVLYDDVVKVPLIIRWPGEIPAGAVCGQFVYNALDLPPTLLEMAHLPKYEAFHGRSLAPLWQFAAGAPDWRKAAVSTYNGQQFGLYTQRMLRTREWKYIWNLTDVDELYDLVGDPGEMVNMIHEDNVKNLVSELRKQLFEELLAVDDGLAKSPWMRDQLLLNKKL